MIAHKFLILLLIGLPMYGTSQITMDIELLGGITLNGNKYDYSDDTYNFQLKNGSSYGLGFDIWFPKEYALSFGYRLSQSVTRSTINYPEGFRTSQTSFPNGVLKDRIFYLGLKKKFHLGNTFSLTPFTGLYYNSFFFDNEDREGLVVVERENQVFFENKNFHARFNNRGSMFYGALGAQLGIGISKKIPKVGSFSLNMSYSIDFRRSVEQSVYAFAHNVVSNIETGEIEHTNYYYNYESRNLARNFIQIEVGFKMPCSILLSKKKANKQ